MNDKKKSWTSALSQPAQEILERTEKYFGRPPEETASEFIILHNFCKYDPPYWFLLKDIKTGQRRRIHSMNICTATEVGTGSVNLEMVNGQTVTVTRGMADSGIRLSDEDYEKFLKGIFL